MNKRIHYLDVAKGLLILMVAWGHYELILRLCFKISDPTINILDNFETAWVSFFMPAFFFITGLCTNFNRPFKQFLISRVKSLLIPAVIINYLYTGIDYISMGADTVWICKTMAKGFLLNCAGEWFIPSLFIASLITWCLVKIPNKATQFILASICLILGIYLYNFDILPEIWYFKHALMVVIFILIGKSMKNVLFITPPDADSHKQLKSNRILFTIIQFCYIPIIVILLLCGISIPYITNRVSVSMPEIPLVFILAATGTLMALTFAKCINKNRVLEYLGRNSLVIYLAHFIFYRIYISYAQQLYNQSTIISVALFLGIYILNILTCCALAYLLNTKYLKWILGKF